MKCKECDYEYESAHEKKEHMRMHHSKHHHRQEPYGHLNLSEDPSMFLSSEQRKIDGKLRGGYDLDVRL